MGNFKAPNKSYSNNHNRYNIYILCIGILAGLLLNVLNNNNLLNNDYDKMITGEI